MNSGLQQLSNDLPQRLAERLQAPPPGWRVQRNFQPAMSFGRYFGPVPTHARPAAVLILLYPWRGEWHVPLTLRPAHLSDHAGQISLPGGSIELGERAPDAALRELEEELGVSPRDVELVGELSPIYLYRTNYQISPWLAFMAGRPQWQPNPTEVAELLETPLTALCDPAQRGVELRERGLLTFRAPYFLWQDHRIWGATSLILGELVALVEEVEAVVSL